MSVIFAVNFMSVNRIEALMHGRSLNVPQLLRLCTVFAGYNVQASIQQVLPCGHLTIVDTLLIWTVAESPLF